MSQGTKVGTTSGRLFRVFIEIFSIVAALLLFASAYLQYRIFEPLGVPFYLVASTEDIILGGFAILSITLDFFFDPRFWAALPMNAMLLGIALFLATVAARGLGIERPRRRLLLLLVFLTLMLLVRTLVDNIGVYATQIFGHDAGGTIGAGPPLSNAASTPNDVLRYVLIWLAVLVVPLGFAVWGARRQFGKWLPHRAIAAFAAPIGGWALLAILVLLSTYPLPGLVARSFSWGKGEVTELPNGLMDRCPEGTFYLVWSGSKADILRCAENGRERDYIYMNGENMLVNLNRQNVRIDGRLEKIE